MAGVTLEPGERQSVAGAAALMIKAQGIRASEGQPNSVINREGQGAAHPRNDEAIFAWCVEVAEVGLVNFLVRSRGVLITDIGALNQIALIDLGTRVGVHQLESTGGGNRRFAEAAGVIADH